MFRLFRMPRLVVFKISRKVIESLDGEIKIIENHPQKRKYGAGYENFAVEKYFTQKKSQKRRQKRF